MLTWTLIIIAGLSATFVALGNAFDRFMLRHQKVALHTSMYRWWERIYEASLRDLRRETALELRAMYALLMHPQGQSFATAVRIFIFSAISCVGMSVYFHNFYPNWDRSASWLLIAMAFLMSITIFFSLFVADQLLALVANGNVVTSFLGIVGYSVISLMIATLSLGATTTMYNYELLTSNVEEQLQHYIPIPIDSIDLDPAGESVSIKDLEINYTRRVFLSAEWLTVLLGRDEALTAKDTITYEISVKTTSGNRDFSGRYSTAPPKWWIVLVAIQSLAPTAMVLVSLTITVLAKFTVTRFRRFALHLLEVATEVDPQTAPDKFAPGTLVGILFAIIAAVSTAIFNAIRVFERW